MPMMTAALISGGSQLFGSLMGGQASAAQAAAQKAQFEWNEHMRKMDTQKQNREIAKKNALRWQQNRDIAKAANTTRAEEEFWVNYNYDNEVGEFSRQYKQANDQLISNLHGRGINPKSQTAKLLLRQSLGTAKKALVARSITKENAMRTASRRQDNALAQRDFGYNTHITFMPGIDTSQDPGDIMQNALMSGIVGGAAAGFGAYGAESFRQDQLKFMNSASSGPQSPMDIAKMLGALQGLRP